MEQGSTLLRFNQNREDVHLTSTRKEYLLTGLIASMQKGFYFNSLKTGMSEDELHALLISITKPKQESSITEMLNFLRHEGERTAYSILLPYLISSKTRKEIENTLRKRFFGIELFVQRVHNICCFLDYIDSRKILSIKEDDLQRGILAWDMGELISLARVAYETGYIDEATVWDHIEFAAQQCRNTYQNREQASKGYLIGQAMKCNGKEELDKAIECFLMATQNLESPWE